MIRAASHPYLFLPILAALILVTAGPRGVAGQEDAERAGPSDAGTRLSFSVLDLDGLSNTYVAIDAGYRYGIIAGQRFDIVRGERTLAIVEVRQVYDDRCWAMVIPGTKVEGARLRAGDSAILQAYLPPPQATDGGVVPAPPGYNEARPADDRDAIERAENATRAEEIPDLAPDGASTDQLRRTIADLYNQLIGRTDELRDIEQRYQTERRQRILADNRIQTMRELDQELGRQLRISNSQVSGSTSLGIGTQLGSTVGDPLFGAYPLGLERFAFDGRATLDFFTFGPLDGIRVGARWLEMPAAGLAASTNTLHTRVFTEIYLPLRATGQDTALVIGFAHDRFPAGFRGVTDGGELSISWGKRVPMTKLREADSFWDYEFRPLAEFIFSPYGGTGTDWRVGVGFPDLIEVWVNLNGSYYADAVQWGAFHAKARIPIIQHHGHLGHVKLILAADVVIPFDTADYAHVATIGLHVRAILGR